MVLAVAEIYDREQNTYSCRNRQDEERPHGSQREKNRQGRFGSISCGAECIEAKNADARSGSEPLLLLFVRCQWATEDRIDEGWFLHRAACGQVPTLFHTNLK
jgi:hypothetical protein